MKIPISREIKIILLKSLQSGFLDAGHLKETIKKDRINPFLQLMQEATSNNNENTFD